ncbi:MAG TPA: hypothetical protein DCL95_15960 [Rhodospirillaceae bacterium]|nr:hypothetical protein [Rhodospirillaceae bacterium]
MAFDALLRDPGGRPAPILLPGANVPSGFLPSVIVPFFDGAVIVTITPFGAVRVALFLHCLTIPLVLPGLALGGSVVGLGVGKEGVRYRP